MKTHVTPLAEISDGGTTVAIRHVETPKGERLEVTVPDRDEQVRLDAILLEWVTSQDEATFRRLLDSYAETGARDGDRIVVSDEAEVERSDALATVTNEFAHVDVSKVWTPEAERLALTAPKLGIDCYLNGRALEILTYPSMETFSDLLADQTE